MPSKLLIGAALILSACAKFKTVDELYPERTHFKTRAEVRAECSKMYHAKQIDSEYFKRRCSLVSTY
jgi:hypothetical protein